MWLESPFRVTLIDVVAKVRHLGFKKTYVVCLLLGENTEESLTRSFVPSLLVALIQYNILAAPTTGHNNNGLSIYIPGCYPLKRTSQDKYLNQVASGQPYK